ncbi:MAG: autotransporter outer membrane beta-barrel domain-containing protein [Asticcacaulis sp.]
MRQPRRSLLMAATALGLIFAAAPALATTTISTATTAPVKSSTAASGASDDLDITSDGSITLTSGTAVTLDSDNSLILNGTLEMSGSESGTIGILIDGPRTTTLDISGTITVTDDYTAEDEDDDDIVDGPFAEGTGRYGILATGLITGDADIDATITVHGNQSGGIVFRDGQTGDFSFNGSISVLGDDTVGIGLYGTQTGLVHIRGSVTAQGLNATAIELPATIDGALVIGASVTSTGYRYTSISDDYIDLLDADDLYQSKSAVRIAGDVTGGVLISAAVTGEDDDNDDENGNGIDDADETTAAITQYGSAPALLIGSDSKAITLSALSYNDSATEDWAERTYSLDLRGTVSSAGIYDGVTATGVQIGGTGYTVDLPGGIGVSGTASAAAYEADATAFRLASLSVVPRFDLTGSIVGTVTTTNSNTAYGIDIDAGAYLPTLTIGTGGLLTAAGYGTTANATALRDQSNTLTSLVISGGISASITPGDEDEDDVTDTAVNRPVAIDLSSNTVATNISIVDEYPDDDDYAAPYVSGDIKLGSGDDSISLSGGYIYGNVDFGAGANSLTIDDGGVVIGKLTGTGTVAADIEYGSLSLLTGTRLNLTSLHLGSESSLIMVLETANPTTAPITNSGTTVFDDGAAIYLTLDAIIQSPTRFTLLTGSNIDYGSLDLEDMEEKVPWLYKANLATNSDGSNLYADFRLRTQSESGLTSNEYGALGAVLTAASTDTDTTSTLLSPTTESDFIKTYAAFLPDFSGENLLSLSRGREATTRAIEKQSILPQAGESHYWLMEHGYVLSRDRGQTLGFETTGFSFGGAIERGLGYGQAAGLYVNYTAATPKDSYATAYETSSAADFTVGGYWRLDSGGLKAWASAGAGRAFFRTERQMVGASNTLTASAKWNGISLSGSTGASYRAALGPISVKPLVSVDYYALKEDGREESGGGTAFDLSVDERESHIATASALLSFGRNDKRALVQPEVWVGYKNNFSVDVSDTVARFSGGSDFVLSGGDLKGGSPVLGLRVSAGNEYGYISLEAEGEKYSEYSNYSMTLRTGFKF